MASERGEGGFIRSVDWLGDNMVPLLLEPYFKFLEFALIAAAVSAAADLSPSAALSALSFISSLFACCWAGLAVAKTSFSWVFRRRISEPKLLRFGFTFLWRIAVVMLTAFAGSGVALYVIVTVAPIIAKAAG